jgi:tight adherence protein B
MPTVTAPSRTFPMRVVVRTAVVAAAVLLTITEGSGLVLGLILLSAGLGTARLVDGMRHGATARRREEKVLEICEVLVGELRAGQPPVTALKHCSTVWPEFEPVATAARLGADVPAAMRRLGASPGASGLRVVAAAWQVSASSGAGLAMSLGQVAESARESQATRRRVATELASAQATARLIAVLPLAALAMASGVGGNPWHFLLETPAGLGCLGAGLGLVFLGLLWIERIAESVLIS